MSPRAWQQRVQDILAAIREIQSFVGGQTFDQFANDTRTLKAVLADFTIIGEAAGHIPEDVQDANPKIAWRQMRDMRNIVVHVYFAVNPRIVWDTIHNDLPALETQLMTLVSPRAKS